MAGLINLRLLTDFFNKIGPKRHFAAPNAIGVTTLIGTGTKCIGRE